MVAFLSHRGGSSSMLAMLEWSKAERARMTAWRWMSDIWSCGKDATEEAETEEVIEEEKRSLNFNSVCAVNASLRLPERKAKRLSRAASRTSARGSSSNSVEMAF